MKAKTISEPARTVGARPGVTLAGRDRRGEREVDRQAFCARAGLIRGPHWNISGIHRRLWHPHHSDDRAVFSGDRVSHAAVRNMMCCAVSEQGAGVAAAISRRTGEPFDRLDVGAVQTELRRQGARIQ